MSEQSSVYTAYRGNSYLFGGNAPYVEEMYENYLANPGSVPDMWRDYFDALQNVAAVTPARKPVSRSSRLSAEVRRTTGRSSSFLSWRTIV